MRPQHITAENLSIFLRLAGADPSFNEAAAYHCGKPLPSSRSLRTPSGFNEAAAYHCGKPDARSGRLHRYSVASMRPQHITAENLEQQSLSRACGSGFNEAAAYHCGKPAILCGRWFMCRCFNEAAAYHCGKPAGSVKPPPDSASGFNEAAAYHCGKPNKNS